MIKPIALSATHMECRNLRESMAVLIDLLAFEKVGFQDGEVLQEKLLPIPEKFLISRMVSGDALGSWESPAFKEELVGGGKIQEDIFTDDRIIPLQGVL